MKNKPEIVENWLPRYTGTALTDFSEYILLTNFDNYVEDAFFPKGDWEDKIETSLLMSAGATFSYNSLLGPVNFDISYINDVDKIRLYFSVGFLFNASN